MKKQLLTIVLILCLLLCSCTPGHFADVDTDTPSSEPSTEPSQVTDPSTEPPTEPPTDPPTEPPTEPLTEPDEFAHLQDLFTWPSCYAVASNFTFSSPSERSLEELLREGPAVETHFEMSEEETAYLSAISEGFIYLDTHRISKENAIRVLDQYYGLTLEDFPDLGSMVYWEETDCFYYYGGGSAVCFLTITHAEVQEDGTINVLYRDELGMQRTGEMILKPTETGYQILSNQTSM